MRTTLTIEDETFRKLKGIGHRTGKSFKAIVNEALRAGIENEGIASPPRAYRTRPVAMGEVVGPYDLDKALQLADRLEDEETKHKLQLRK